MPKITVDPDKCAKDGICSRVCVVRIITKPNKDRCPEIVPEWADRCIGCGHCVSACPTGALSHDLAPLADCQEIDTGASLGSDAIEGLLKRRRSIRVYNERPVPHDAFIRLMEVGRYAPTGSNRQDVRFLICDNREDLKPMAGMVIEFMQDLVDSGKAGNNEDRYKWVIQGWNEGHDTILRNAPAMIVAHSDVSLSPSQTNGIIAMGYIELMAHALGLGACYCGFFNNAANNYPALKKRLGLPETHMAAATLLLGYPNVQYYRIPPRNKADYRFL